MIASLLSGLDSDLRGFKDQILASETLPTAVNAYSRLLHSSLGQNSLVTSLDSSALLSSSGGSGNSHGGGRTSGRGDKKCDHCGGLNHTEPG